jgi:dihydromethanopterin reductase
MTDIRLIAAVGRRGQLGLGGALPWQEPEDLQWFRQQTMGGVVVLGRRTFEAIGHRLVGRTVVCCHEKVAYAYDWLPLEGNYSVSNARGGLTLDDPLPLRIAAHFLNRTIWVAGGARVYEAWMPYVRRAVVTLIDYDGPADVWMPPLWGEA